MGQTCEFVYNDKNQSRKSMKDEEIIFKIDVEYESKQTGGSNNNIRSICLENKKNFNKLITILNKITLNKSKQTQVCTRINDLLQNNKCNTTKKNI